MSDFSPADMAAVMDGGRNNNGWGGDGAWIWVVIFMIFGWGRGGWGNQGSDGAPVTEAGLCNAMNFNNLENAVGRLSDAQTSQFTQLTNGMCNLGYELQGLNNATNVAMLQGFNAVQSQQQNCCCTIERGLDAVNYNGAMNTASIISSQKDGTQAILDKLCTMENQGLRDKVQALELNQALCGVVRYPQGMTYTAGVSPFFNQGCCSGYGNI